MEAAKRHLTVLLATDNITMRRRRETNHEFHAFKLHCHVRKLIMTLVERKKLARLVMLKLLPIFGGLTAVAVVALSTIA